MKLIFIFAIWLFVVYGVEGCFLLDMAARTLSNLLAPPPRPRVITVINSRSRPPRPKPAAVHTLYRPQRINFGIGTTGGGIAVARSRPRPRPNLNYERTVIPKPRESPLVGFLGSIFSPPSDGGISKPKKSPMPRYRNVDPPRINGYGYGYYGRVNRPGNIVISNAKNNQNIKVKNLRRRKYDESSEEWDD